MNSPGKTSAEGLLEFSSGQYVVKEGDRGSEMYIVEQGEVEILKLSGGEERRLLLLKRGDFFGEESVVARLPRLASARAVSDCRLLPVDESTLREMLDQGAIVGLRLLQGVSRRLRESFRLVPAAATSSPETQRVTTDKPEQAKVETPAGVDRLVHSASGVEFTLPESGDAKVGRHDAVTGFDPDIDLTSVDDEHSLSRSHAEILRREGKFFVSDEIGSANGTFVNDQKVEKGAPVEIKDGDEVRFGLIKTHFRVAG